MLTTNHYEAAPNLLKRTGVLLYGVGSYGLGVATLSALILLSLDIVPFNGGGLDLSGGAAIAFSVLLMLGFGIQHSVMARKHFKAKLYKIMPKAMERSTFVLATALVLGPALYLFQPMGDVIWSVDNQIVSVSLRVLCGLGWAYLLLASFAINHFELFGLQQVYEYFTRRQLTVVPFKERLMYRFDRHPIMTGVIVGIWATPEMHLDHLVLAIATSVYIVIGVYFEERALRRDLGKVYDDYAKRVGTIVPSFSEETTPSDLADANQPQPQA